MLLLLLVSIALSKYPVIYEISTRPWLYELSKKTGKTLTKLRDIPLTEFDTLKNKGIDYVWMMGVWQLGDYGLQIDKKSDFSSVLPGYTQDDIIGSPYAITEYTCNTELGSDSDIQWLRQQLNAKGIKLMLDFVPNHSACDAAEVTSKSKLYIRAGTSGSYDSKYYLPNGVAHGKDPYFDPWPDTAQWNYFEPETRTFMTNNLLKVASLADGIRCDMAHLDLNDVFKGTWAKELAATGYSVPSTEFWTDAIKTVKAKYPNLILMAEVYEDWEMTKLKACGFDYYYDKAFLDKCESGVTDVNNYVHYKDLEFLNNGAHFVENHDENRAVYNMGSVNRADAAGAMAATLPGLIFFNHGQFDGLKNKLDVHLRRSADETKSTVAQNFYAKLTEILKNDAFKTKSFYFVYNVNGDNAWRFASWIRGTTTQFLVVVNYSDGYGCANVPIYNINGSGDVKVLEMMSGTEYTRTGSTLKSTGLTVCLNAWETQIFKYNY
ncbi:hypothetical protein EIN_296610 [Entamoeba invadens IP1]|uniref:Glycosyl hydrolase family 13 catalytic domain-containing protein n=2 Tax=Entamoeba invadens TaxID=33085 RepID=L7FMH3_ENTIV|nr:hypothetical protein EIN_296610 [Entamoeba invadens IP1]ELP86351.1 hypothetical protein EIN_296610 [Entamoeba invadens IP1]BAN40292.1 hypothetical protein, conserved [Entamoeba invadens]BAN42206.1 hypothetical protein, conserved [Entamoeba invadens]|eukprot:XP_004185697.1 hypothetical protein EIN_296610 [Entamoeba invadens IP1]